MNRKLPTKRDYENFISEFSDFIMENFPNACFYRYGSFVDGSCNYGRSDIDGGIILDSGVKTDKPSVIRIARRLAETTCSRGIRTQFNLTDRVSNKDGRFLSYTSDYTDFVKASRVLTGQDLVKEMNGLDNKPGSLSTAAMNFTGPGGIRNALLYCYIAFEDGEKEFADKTEKALEKTAKLPKKLVLAQTGKLYPRRREAKSALERLLPGINLERLNGINYLLDNPELLFSSIRDFDLAMELLCTSLGLAEEMIDSYIDNFPPRQLKVETFV